MILIANKIVFFYKTTLSTPTKQGFYSTHSVKVEYTCI